MLPQTTNELSARRGSQRGRWRDQIDVADFIGASMRLRTGDAALLAGPTARTTARWGRLRAMFAEERARGVHDVDPATPASIRAHAPGDIDRDN